MQTRSVMTVKAEIEALGPVLPGSISKQWNVCGKPGCRCKDPKHPQRHGPYYQLSYTLAGHSSTMFLKPGELAMARRCVAAGVKVPYLAGESVPMRTSPSGSRFFLHPIALSLDGNGFAVMEEAIEDGGGQCGVLVEDARPLFVDRISGYDGCAVFIASAYDLEEQVGAMFVHRQIAQFVYHEKSWRNEGFKSLGQGVGRLGG